MLCLHYTSYPLKVLKVGFGHCAAFLLHLIEDSRTALMSINMPQLRGQCLQVTNVTNRTKSTGNDDKNTISQYISYINLFLQLSSYRMKLQH